MKIDKDDLESKIVKFDPTRVPARIKPRERYCNHPYVVVCEKTRMLECESCQQVIDPFDYIWEWARRDRSLEWTRKALKLDIEKLEAKMIELKRDERNTRARLRRIGKM